MNESLTIRVLEQVMRWDDDTIAKEAIWLRFMSDMKYDHYRGFLGGIRFSERLVDWLQQFSPEDRQTAYNHIRRHLVFISQAELQHLVERFFPTVVEQVLVGQISAQLNVPRYLLWTHEKAESKFEDALRRCLFIGLSDGARTDQLRRANEARISNEQVLVTTQVNDSKLKSVVKQLRVDVKDESAKFRNVFLIDDFVGSGRTLLREENGMWKGKLEKFIADHSKHFADIFEDEWHLHVHHYLSSFEASGRISENETRARSALGKRWFKNINFSYGLTMPADSRLQKQTHPEFWELTDRYYDFIIDDGEAIQVGGESAVRGFSGCGLSLVLEHNTPNNSVALLWAETVGQKGHAMRPLFRRAQRHQ